MKLAVQYMGAIAKNLQYVVIIAEISVSVFYVQCGHLSSHKHFLSVLLHILYGFFSTRCNIHISRLCYDVSVHHCGVHLSVMKVHWRIIANLGFKFRSQFTTHCGRGACGREGRDHRREEWRDHLALC